MANADVPTLEIVIDYTCDRPHIVSREEDSPDRR